MGRNYKAEADAQKAFHELQSEIFRTFGQRTPSAPVLKCRNATQTSVLAIQQRGVDIRANNQKLAKEINSPAADGLAIVAGAQTKEIDQVKSLKGNAAADGETIKMLVQEVMDGTMQNQKNLQAAKGQACAK